MIPEGEGAACFDGPGNWDEMAGLILDDGYANMPHTPSPSKSAHVEDNNNGLSREALDTILAQACIPKGGNLQQEWDGIEISDSPCKSDTGVPEPSLEEKLTQYKEALGAVQQRIASASSIVGDRPLLEESSGASLRLKLTHLLESNFPASPIFLKGSSTIFPSLSRVAVRKVEWCLTTS